MHRKITLLSRTLPAWFSYAGLGLVFATVFLSLTRDDLPQQIFMLLQSLSSPGAAPAGLLFGEMLVTAFLLYGVLSISAGLLVGMFVNHVFKLIWNLVVCCIPD